MFLHIENILGSLDILYVQYVRDSPEIYPSQSINMSKPVHEYDYLCLRQSRYMSKTVQKYVSDSLKEE